MTREEKQLLLIDLSARLPYKVKGIYARTDIKNLSVCEITTHLYGEMEESFNEKEKYEFIPYLRPMSSMTEEEKDNLQSLHDIISNENYGDGYSPSAWNAITEWEDYCNARHLDYRGLIPMGLALEAPKDMYKTE